MRVGQGLLIAAQRGRVSSPVISLLSEPPLPQGQGRLLGLGGWERGGAQTAESTRERELRRPCCGGNPDDLLQIPALPPHILGQVSSLSLDLPISKVGADGLLIMIQ